MRYSSAMLGAPPGSSFEVFGVDMLVDTDYRPWLVEINAVPSLARKVSHASRLPFCLVHSTSLHHSDYCVLCDSKMPEHVSHAERCVSCHP